MFSVGPGDGSFVHTGAGTLYIASLGAGVKVQDVSFEGGNIDVASGGGVKIGGQQVLGASGLYFGETMVEMGHVQFSGEAYLPQLAGSGSGGNYRVRMEFNPKIPGTDNPATLFDDSLRDGTFHLEVPGGIWLNGTADDPLTPPNEGRTADVFVVNGVKFISAPGDDSTVTPEDDRTGVSLPAGGGAWDTQSDARRKTDWQTADPESFLRGIAGLDIRSWRYQEQDASIRHVGPTAQDFRAAFGLGTNDTTISTVDADGASMLAIQALAKRTDELRAATERIAELERRLAALEALVTIKK